MPPLGLAYISSYLVSKGISCSVIDLNARIYNLMDEDKRKELWKPENIRCWAEKAFFSDIFYSLRPHIKLFLEEALAPGTYAVGFSVNRSNMLFSIELAKLIKEANPKSVIVFGGPSCWLRSKDNIPDECRDIRTEKLAFSPGLIDAFVVGEGENAAFEIISRLKSGNGLTDIPGTVIYRGEGLYSGLTPVSASVDIDRLPQPTFCEFELWLYSERILPVLFSRGCVGKCVFCNDPGMAGSYRARSARHVFQEVKYHVENNGIKRFHSCDLLANGNLNFLDEFSGLVIESGYKITWSGQALVRADMSERLLTKMKRAGCDSLVFGVESFSDKVLRLMGKSFNSKQAELALRRCRDCGIKAAINIIVGFPGENEGDFNVTIEAIKRNRKVIDCVSSVSTAVLTPGSPLSNSTDVFGIKRSTAGNYSCWKSEDGSNDYALRKKRLLRLTGYLKEWGIRYLSTNLYDDEFGNLSSRIGPYLRYTGAGVLLAICPSWGVAMPPLGLASIVSYLQQRGGVHVDVIDLNIMLFNRVDDDKKMLWEFRNSSHWTDKESFERLKEVMDKDIDFCVDCLLNHPGMMIGFSVYSANRFFTIEVIRRLRQKDQKRIIVVGGRGCINNDSRLVFNLGDVDIFVEGEGEETMLEIVKEVKTRGEVKSIPGAVFCKGGRLYCLGARPAHKDISSLPFPDYKGFALRQYCEEALALLMSRGCIGRCSFCDDYKLMGEYRVRRAENVLDEIRYHLLCNRINDFYFSDAAINGNLRELENLCDGIIKGKIAVRWIALAIPRKDMEYRLLEKMSRAGCRTLNYGVETGSDIILSRMRKIVRISDVEEVLKNTRRAGITTQLNFVVGFPGEGESEFNDTLDFIRRNRHWINGVTNINACNVLLNSDLFERADEYGVLLPNELSCRDTGWYTGDGNDYAVRAKRVEEVVALLKELGIPIITSNLQEKEADLRQL